MAITGAPAGWINDWAAAGHGENSRIGIILVHGFTGSPASMRPWGEYLNSKGYTVRVPLLPGHGTKVEDLNTVKWQEWPAKVIFEIEQIQQSCDKIILIGLSMGASTILNVTASMANEDINHKKIAGMILVNPMIHVRGVPAELAYFLSRFQRLRKSVGEDIKRPGITEWGYDALPTRGVHQLLRMLRITRRNLPAIKIPLQLFHSVSDHTLPVSNTEIVLKEIGSVEKNRIELMNSYHVATMDYDQELIFHNSLTFIESLTNKQN
ncbi:MAG: alpha/beta fold hydrolase [Streptomycetaceae bacterium]|nr:alpha/beta fold hydrolase [Streptomycetaceae bacterium]